MKKESLELSPIALKQAKVTDADKARYRVYRTKDDYVAVIAENALMAMKVAEIKEPYKIVRDLPTHEISIAEDRLQRETAETSTRFHLPTELKTTERAPPRVELRQKTDTPQSLFKAMGLKDLQIHIASTPRSVAPAAALSAPAVIASAPTDSTASSAEAVSEMVAVPSSPEPLSSVDIQPEISTGMVKVDEKSILSPEDVAKLLGT